MNGSVVPEDDGQCRGANASEGKSLQFAQCTLDNYKQQRSSYWVRLRKRRARRGVVEVDVDHHRFPTLAALKIGLRRIIEDHPEHSPKECVGYDDCKCIHEERIPLAGGKECVFRSYASAVFATLRRSMEVSEEEYLEALASQTLPFLEFISNSKSGQDFFFSNNQKFMLKTERLRCINHFYNILWDYVQHLLTYPHSLLVKFLGLYSIKMPGLRIKYFMVMQSVFYPVTLIEDRFDLKGCTAGRYQQPPPAGANVMTVLKDVNFLKDKVQIELGVQREWFRRQLLLDTQFLKRVRVLDYSLLVARQPVPAAASHQDLPTVVTRVTRSVTRYSTCDTSPLSADVSANALDDSQDSRDAVSLSPRRHKGRSNVVMPLRGEEARIPRSDGTERAQPCRKAILKEEPNEDGCPCERVCVIELSDSRGGESREDLVEHLRLFPASSEHGAAGAASDENPKQEADHAWTSADESVHAGTSGEVTESYRTFEDHGGRVAWERNSERLLSTRTTKSVRPTPPSTASDVVIRTPRTEGASQEKTKRPLSVSQVSQTRSDTTTFTLELQSLPGSVADRSAADGAAGVANQGQSLVTRRFGTLKDIEAENRRLLPNCENALHIIDGPHDRYYIGLVDFFTTYQCWQRTARYVKAVRYRSCDHSTLPPNEYADRLVRFIFNRLR